LNQTQYQNAGDNLIGDKFKSVKQWLTMTGRQDRRYKTSQQSF